MLRFIIPLSIIIMLTACAGNDIKDTPESNTASVASNACFAAARAAYKGSCSNGKANGLGTYTFSDGKKFVGQFKNGKRSGRGTTTFPDGDKFVGQFKNDESNGLGTYTFSDGRKYVGQFKNGKLHGQGIYTSGNVAKYEGQFKNGKPNGQGAETFSDGRKYEGQFKNGKPIGQGTLTYANGRVHIGQVKNGGAAEQAAQTARNIASTARFTRNEFNRTQTKQRRKDRAAQKRADRRRAKAAQERAQRRSVIDGYLRAGGTLTSTGEIPMRSRSKGGTGFALTLTETIWDSGPSPSVDNSYAPNYTRPPTSASSAPESSYRPKIEKCVVKGHGACKTQQ